MVVSTPNRARRSATIYGLRAGEASRLVPSRRWVEQALKVSAWFEDPDRGNSGPREPSGRALDFLRALADGALQVVCHLYVALLYSCRVKRQGSCSGVSDPRAREWSQASLGGPGQCDGMAPG